MAKKLLSLSFIVILLFNCVVWGFSIVQAKADNPNVSHINDILKKVDNLTDKDKLITKPMSHNDIQYLNFIGTSLEKIDSKYGIECLRSVDGLYYSVHKSDTEGYFYLFYKMEDTTKMSVVYARLIKIHLQ